MELFHEVENILGIITVDKVKKYYELKRKIKGTRE